MSLYQYSPLDMSVVAMKTQTQIIGSRLHYYPELDSSNNKIAEFADKNAPDGTVVVTDYQTAGRGRENREWVSPSNRNLLFSYVIRPPTGLQGIHQITTMTAVGCVDSIRSETGLDVTIKWPNDIRVNRKKIGGILTETKTRDNKTDYIIVGIGININMELEDFPKELRKTATSLFIELHQASSRENLLISLLTHLDRSYLEILETGFSPMIDKWKILSDMVARLVTVRDRGKTIEGYVTNIDTEGELLIRKKNGIIEKIISGDIHFHD